MPRSLVGQLSQRAADVPASLDALFSSCEDGKRQPSLDALLRVAHQTMQWLPQVYVILDALDKCAQRVELMDGWLAAPERASGRDKAPRVRHRELTRGSCASAEQHLPPERGNRQRHTAVRSAEAV
jgi:hypothetical protein